MEREWTSSLVSLTRTLMLSDQSPTLMTPFYLIYFLRGPVSKYSHAGGFRLQLMNFGGDTIQSVICFAHCLTHGGCRSVNICCTWIWNVLGKMEFAPKALAKSWRSRGPGEWCVFLGRHILNLCPLIWATSRCLGLWLPDPPGEVEELQGLTKVRGWY